MYLYTYVFSCFYIRTIHVSSCFFFYGNCKQHMCILESMFNMDLETPMKPVITTLEMIGKITGESF